MKEKIEDDIKDILEPLKVESALRSEEMKLNYRKEHKPKDINILDYTIIEALRKQIPQKPIEKHYEEEGEKPYIKYKCPSCKSKYQISKDYDNYCSKCGQKIDWD